MGAEKGKKAPAPKKVDASKKEAKDGKAPVKAVQKALKIQKKVVKGAHGTRGRRSEQVSSSTDPRPSDHQGTPSIPASPLPIGIRWMLTPLSRTPSLLSLP